MTLFQKLFPRRQSRREAELAYLNAAVSRYEALDIYNEFRCARTAAAICGLRKGLNLQTA